MVAITRVSSSFVVIGTAALSTLPNVLVEVIDEAVGVSESATAMGVEKVARVRETITPSEQTHWLGAERIVVASSRVIPAESMTSVGPIVRVVRSLVSVTESANYLRKLSRSGLQLKTDRPSRIKAIFADIAPIEDGDADRPTVHMFASYTSRTSAAPSILAYENIDDNKTQILGSLPEPSIMGTLLSQDIKPHVRGLIDRASTIDVRVSSGEIETITEGEMIAGGNRVFMDGMVFAFQTATQLTELYEYRLSGLLWGLLNTPLNPQTRNLTWALLDGPRLSFSVPWSSLDDQRRISVVPAGYDANPDGDDYSDEVFVGRSVKPIEVANVRGSKDSSNNWRFSWDRVSRLPRQRIFGVRSVRDLDPRTYTVQVVDGSATVQTIAVSDSEAAAYSVQQEIGDFGGSQDALSIRVTRTSEGGDSAAAASIVSIPYAVQNPFPEDPSTEVDETPDAVLIESISADATLSAQYAEFLLCNAVTGSFTIYLPDATTSDSDGKRYTFKKVDTSSGIVTLSASGGDTIDGEPTRDLRFRNTSLSLVPRGTQWYIE